MSKNDDGAAGASLNEVKQAVAELLGLLSSPDLAASDLFPHGVNQISLHVRAGELAVSLEMSGPDHSHPHEEEGEEWLEDDEDDLFAKDDLP